MWKNVFLGFLLLELLAIAWANTEIINFEANESLDIALPLTEQLTILTAGSSEHFAEVVPAKRVEASPRGLGFSDSPHDLWILLDLDAEDWLRYSKFTLRISWPASSPADFLIKLYSPREYTSLFSASSSANTSSGVTTRQKLAQIIVIDTAVRTPSLIPTSHTFSPEPIPLMLTVEPLYLGILPASILPILGLLVAAILFAALLVLPFVQSWIFSVAWDVSAELSVSQRLNKKSQ